MTDDISNAQLLAAAAGIALQGNKLIGATDRTSFHEVSGTLDAVFESLAIVGGSVAMLAGRLGCTAEFEGLVKKGQDRLTALEAGQSLSGRA